MASMQRKTKRGREDETTADIFEIQAGMSFCLLCLDPHILCIDDFLSRPQSTIRWIPLERDMHVSSSLALTNIREGDPVLLYHRLPHASSIVGHALVLKIESYREEDKTHILYTHHPKPSLLLQLSHKWTTPVELSTIETYFQFNHVPNDSIFRQLIVPHDEYFPNARPSLLQLKQCDIQIVFDCLKSGSGGVETCKLSYVKFSKEDFPGFQQIINDTQRSGGGSFGKVYKVRYRDRDVALKKLFLKDEVQFLHEVQMLNLLKHQNIVQFLGVIEEHFIIVTEWVEHGSLRNHLVRDAQPKFSLHHRLLMLMDIASAMTMCNSLNPKVCHHDLKPENLLLDKHDRIKICDFGLSNLVSSSGSARIGSKSFGTAMYFDANAESNEQTDVYSFGKIIYEVLYWDNLAKEEYQNSTEPVPNLARLSADDPAISKIGRYILNLIEQCLSPPMARPTFSDIHKSLSTALVREAFNIPVGSDYLLDHDAMNFWGSFRPRGTKDPYPVLVPVAPFFERLNLLGTCTPEVDAQVRTYLERLSGSKEYVTLSAYSELLSYFGPHCEVEERLSAFFHLPYFHLNYTGKELSQRPTGTYLLRLSSQPPDQFTVSVVRSESTQLTSVQHTRIQFDRARKLYEFSPIGSSTPIYNASIAALIQENCEAMFIPSQEFYSYPLVRACVEGTYPISELARDIDTMDLSV